MLDIYGTASSEIRMQSKNASKDTKSVERVGHETYLRHEHWNLCPHALHDKEQSIRADTQNRDIKELKEIIKNQQKDIDALSGKIHTQQ